MHTFYKKFTNQGPSYFGDVDEADGELVKYEEAAEQGGTFVASSMVGSSPNSWQSGRRRMHTYTKCLAFPPTDRLYLQYHVGQAYIHPTSCHRTILHQPFQTASARRLMGMVPQHQNLTANLSNAQNRTRWSRLPVLCRQIRLPLHWHMPVRPPRTSPSYLWKASCHQRCRQRRKWRACFSSCVSAHWSMSILGISFASCTTYSTCHLDCRDHYLTTFYLSLVSIQAHIVHTDSYYRVLPSLLSHAFKLSPSLSTHL
jgi:hypothetical protein